MHVWIEMGSRKLSPYHRGWTPNWSPHTLAGYVSNPRATGGCSVGTVPQEGYGYVAALSLVGKPSEVDELLSQLEALSHAPGFVVDLRMCGGGDVRR